ncbi:hypothetical protein EOL70_05405 [Leucothrix sargassi]|nr:hypothetical protein EOL70_05405 [Leucothrix sargassi]
MTSPQAVQESSSSFSYLLTDYLDQTGDNGAELLDFTRRYIKRLSKNHYEFSWAEQQDILQEMAIILLCQGERYRSHFSKRLLYVMVRNQCIDQIRKNSRHLSTLVLSDNDMKASPPPSVADGADAEMFHHLNCLERIFGVIESQPTGQEDMRIYTQYAFGLSHMEISKSTSRSVNAIAGRLSTLRTRLRKLRNELC